jgi:hypothetical protein
MNSDQKTLFEREATKRGETLIVQYLRFLSHTKKYWLAPIIAVLLIIGLLVMLGGGTAGAFIYTLF